MTWTGNADADLALILLDRLDDAGEGNATRIEQLEELVRKMAADAAVLAAADAADQRSRYCPECEARGRADAAQGGEAVAWKCSKCGAVSECQGALAGENWCASCGACETMRPLVHPAPAPAVPETYQLLTLAVECGVIRMSQVMSADLQDALVEFAKRLAAAPDSAPKPEAAAGKEGGA